MKTVSRIDISANRKSKKYSLTILTKRIFWTLVLPIFRFSPRPLFGLRRNLLRLFGARIGKNVNIYGSAIIYMPWNLEINDWASIGEDAYIYNLGKVYIDRYVTVSQRAHLCAGTHDYTRADLPLLKLPIRIGEQAWVCADAFIGPNVTIGEGSIIGARAVVTKNVDAWTIVAGNPAKTIKTRPFPTDCKNAIEDESRY